MVGCENHPALDHLEPLAMQRSPMGSCVGSSVHKPQIKLGSAASFKEAEPDLSLQNPPQRPCPESQPKPLSSWMKKSDKEKLEGCSVVSANRLVYPDYCKNSKREVKRRA